jgi:hypothetical protein
MKRFLNRSNEKVEPWPECRWSRMGSLVHRRTSGTSILQSASMPKRAARSRTLARALSMRMWAAMHAMTVSWRKGYEGASGGELAKAMKVPPPNLYAAFGNKESLFLRALERCAEGSRSVRFESSESAECSSGCGAISLRYARGKEHPSSDLDEL